MNDIINTIDILGEQAVEDLLLTGELTEFADIRVTTLGGFSGLGDLPKLERVSLPLLNPAVTVAGTVQQNSLTRCTALETVVLPSATSLQYNSFEGCTALKTIMLPKIEKVLYSNVFKGCTAFNTLILPNKFAVCPCSTTNNFTGTPFETGSGYVYVPKEMADGSDGVAAYSSATNWSVYAGQFRYIEDYPEILAMVKEEVPWY